MPIGWYYENCDEFKEYVDKVAACRHFTPEKVMKLIITQEYLKMLITEGRCKKC